MSSVKGAGASSDDGSADFSEKRTLFRAGGLHSDRIGAGIPSPRATGGNETKAFNEANVGDDGGGCLLHLAKKAFISADVGMLARRRSQGLAPLAKT